MSLINDALKKAQRERAHPVEKSPITPPPPPPVHGSGGQPLRAKGNPWPIVFVILALLGGGTAVWFLKPGPATPEPAVASNTGTAAPTVQPTTAVEPAPVESVAVAPAPAVAAPLPEPPSLTINLPSPTGPAPVPTPVTAPLAVSTVPAAPAAAPEVAPSQPAEVPAAAPAPAPLQITLQLEDPRILAYLDAAKINGIRAAADDAKLLMNNKVFRAGGVVDRELGLKLVQILPNELVFEDARGIQYRKLL